MRGKVRPTEHDQNAVHFKFHKIGLKEESAQNRTELKGEIGSNLGIEKNDISRYLMAISHTLTKSRNVIKEKSVKRLNKIYRLDSHDWYQI